tara:strand:+ start:1096 stop:1371 length:276 start_codon:yes stop_codon:yes gene_type:complete
MNIFTIYGSDRDGNPVTVELRHNMGHKGSFGAVGQARVEFPGYTWDDACLSPFTLCWGSGFRAFITRRLLRWWETVRPLEGVTQNALNQMA